jgi:hypothetical protein
MHNTPTGLDEVTAQLALKLSSADNSLVAITMIEISRVVEI